MRFYTRRVPRPQLTLTLVLRRLVQKAKSALAALRLLTPRYPKNSNRRLSNSWQSADTHTSTTPTRSETSSQVLSAEAARAVVAAERMKHQADMLDKASRGLEQPGGVDVGVGPEAGCTDEAGGSARRKTSR